MKGLILAVWYLGGPRWILPYTNKYDPLPDWIAIQLNTTILNPPSPWTEVALAAPLIVGFGLDFFLVGGGGAFFLELE